VLTARAENFFRGRRDLADTIARLQAYQEAGAQVLFAPGVADLGDLRRIVESIDRPLSVMCLPGGPSVGELASAGVARVSVGSGFFNAAMGALIAAATELRDEGTLGWWEGALVGLKATKKAFD
jgi:2-methylisocitrate lyase-like PEP mutase family enzyme